MRPWSLLLSMAAVAAILPAVASAQSREATVIDTSRPGEIVIRRPGPADGRYLGVGFAFNPRVAPSGEVIPGLAVVREVAEDSPAKAAGLAVGDTVVAVNGVQLEQRRASMSEPPGTRMSYRVRRNGVERELTFAMGRRPR